MRRRVLLVDDEVAVLLTLKAVLEINGFDVETAASAREAKHLLMTREYNMIVTDMRMETDTAGAEVVDMARNAPNKPAIAMLTAFPVAEEDWRDLGADQMLVKPMNTYVLLQQIEALLIAHEDKKRRIEMAAAQKKSAPAKKPAAKKPVAKKAPVKKAVKVVKAKPAAKKIAKPAKKAAKKAVKKVVKKAAKKVVKKPAKKATKKKSGGKKK
jgi:DNA-binding response OmpR family regulator